MSPESSSVTSSRPSVEVDVAGAVDVDLAEEVADQPARDVVGREHAPDGLEDLVLVERAAAVGVDRVEPPPRRLHARAAERRARAPQLLAAGGLVRLGDARAERDGDPHARRAERLGRSGRVVVGALREELRDEREELVEVDAAIAVRVDLAEEPGDVRAREARARRLAR